MYCNLFFASVRSVIAHPGLDWSNRFCMYMKIKGVIDKIKIQVGVINGTVCNLRNSNRFE